MKAYINRMREERTPHERRQFSLRIAGMVTAVLFVGWLATLGVRFATTEAPVVSNNNANAAASLVAVTGEETRVEEGNWFGNFFAQFDF